VRTGVTEHAYVLFQPPIEPFGLMESSAIREMVDAGYRHAMEELAQRQVEGAVVCFVVSIQSAERV
jgi:hypothetical protein